MIEAMKCVNHGCKAFLAYVVDKTKNTKRLEDIPVVRDFSDVFPEDLSGVPLGEVSWIALREHMILA